MRTLKAVLARIERPHSPVRMFSSSVDPAQKIFSPGATSWLYSSIALFHCDARRLRQLTNTSLKPVWSTTRSLISLIAKSAK